MVGVVVKETRRILILHPAITLKEGGHGWGLICPFQKLIKSIYGLKLETLPDTYHVVNPTFDIL